MNEQELLSCAVLLSQSKAEAELAKNKQQTAKKNSLPLLHAMNRSQQSSILTSDLLTHVLFSCSFVTMGSFPIDLLRSVTQVDKSSLFRIVLSTPSSTDVMQSPKINIWFKYLNNSCLSHEINSGGQIVQETL